MLRKVLMPIMALLGVVLAIRTVVVGGKPVPPVQPVAEPSRAPYDFYVAGAGLVEASTENIAIGTPVGNIVNEVFVKVGSRVKANDPLFKLRDKVSSAELQVRIAAVVAAKAKLLKLKSLPRPEEIPPAQARVTAIEASLADAKNQLKLWESVTDRRAVVQDDIDKKRFAVRVWEAKLTEAQADLKLLKAGAWGPDIAVAEAELAQAESAVVEQEAEIDRRTIRAPVDATVLQVKTRPGEYAQAGPLATPLMVLGDVDRMVVRVDVDENDAWRIDTVWPKRATAFVRGNAQLKTELKFERVEPFVIPKRSLTGESTERVDTRVLQVLYSFERGQLPVYVGQQMDVFIEASPVAGATRPTTTKSVEK